MAEITASEIPAFFSSNRSLTSSLKSAPQALILEIITTSPKPSSFRAMMSAFVNFGPFGADGTAAVGAGAGIAAVGVVGVTRFAVKFTGSS